MAGFAGRLLAGGAALFLAAAAFAADPSDPIPVPKLSGRVVDLTGTLAVPERDAIASRLSAFEAARGSQVVVLLVRPDHALAWKAEPHHGVQVLYAEGRNGLWARLSPPVYNDFVNKIMTIHGDQAQCANRGVVFKLDINKADKNN